MGPAAPDTGLIEETYGTTAPVLGTPPPMKRMRSSELASSRLVGSSGRRSGDCTAYMAILPKAPEEELAWMVHIEPSLPWLIALSIGSTSSPRTSPTITRSGFMPRTQPTRSASDTSPPPLTRSENRRVGKEVVSTCRSRWSQENKKKQNTKITKSAQ